MNKYNESIEFIRNRIYHLETSFKGHADLSYLDNVILPPIRELVERATPMKLNGCKNDWACANCDSDYGIIEGRDYCATCGQALDWDE